MIDANGLFASLSCMTIKARNRLIAFSIMAAPFVFLLGLLIFWDAEPLPPLPTMPNPNGYNDLVKAGKMVSNDFANYDELSLPKLRELTGKNAEALQIARTGLQQTCRVTIDYSPDLGTHFNELPAIKHLALAFAAEGKLAEMENRTNDAIGAYLDLGHLANQSSHGGILTDQLVSLAIEAIEVKHLQQLIDRLDAKSCREIAAALETLDSQGQTWRQVMQQERNWSQRTFTGIRYQLIRLMDRKSQEKTFQKAEQNYNKQRHQTHQLIIDFAARAYELDKGHPPAQLADLVPDYLKAIPQDPFTGTNMVYSPR